MLLNITANTDDLKGRTPLEVLGILYNAMMKGFGKSRVENLERPNYGYLENPDTGSSFGSWRIETEKEQRERMEYEGKRAAERAYSDDVSLFAADIKNELVDRIKDGEEGRTLREWLIEHIDESIDGCSRVIYTSEAKECVMFSDNSGAYFEEFGSEGAVDTDGIQWSRLAAAAFRADIIEELERIDVNVNDVDDLVEEIREEQEEEKRNRVTAIVTSMYDDEAIQEILERGAVAFDEDDDLKEILIEAVMEGEIDEDEITKNAE